MIDATGKLESGLLKGNAKWLGSISECVEIEANKRLPDNSTQYLFDGQYCVVEFSYANSSSTVSMLRSQRICCFFPEEKVRWAPLKALSHILIAKIFFDVCLLFVFAFFSVIKS